MKSKTLTISLNEAKKLVSILNRAEDAELPIPFEELVAASKFRNRVRATADAGKAKPRPCLNCRVLTTRPNQLCSGYCQEVFHGLS